MGTIKIIIADDHPVFVDGLRYAFGKLRSDEFEIIGDAENGEQLVQLVQTLQPHVVLCDIQMPVMDGIRATSLIRQTSPQVDIIALTTFDDTALIIEMLRAGARGYLLKNAPSEEIFKAVKMVFDGGEYYSGRIGVQLARKIKDEHKSNRKERPLFSAREIEIIQLICKGNTSKEVANITGLSKRTVESYREKIMEKAEVKNALELISYAYEHRIATSPGKA